MAGTRCLTKGSIKGTELGDGAIYSETTVFGPILSSFKRVVFFIGGYGCKLLY